mmetsp:Transcript_25846/g.62256  ORF Transcript_25846/g.62256 Transcript_25846/m.62256 type:complete len:116 (+) Transcript_25846:834-1181(+)
MNRESFSCFVNRTVIAVVSVLVYWLKGRRSSRSTWICRRYCRLSLRKWGVETGSTVKMCGVGKTGAPTTPRTSPLSYGSNLLWGRSIDQKPSPSSPAPALAAPPSAPSTTPPPAG